MYMCLTICSQLALNSRTTRSKPDPFKNSLLSKSPYKTAGNQTMAIYVSSTTGSSKCVSNYEVITPCTYPSNTTSHPAHTSQNLYTPMPTSVSSSLCLTARSRLSLSSSTRPTPPARSLPGSRSAPSRRRTKTSGVRILTERSSTSAGESMWVRYRFGL